MERGKCPRSILRIFIFESAITGKMWRGWGRRAHSIPFKYMVNESPSTSVVFALLVGKQIDTGGV